MSGLIHSKPPMRAASRAIRVSAEVFTARVFSARVFSALVFSGLLLAGPAAAFDGPVIGVQIESGNLSRSIVAGPGGIEIEYPGGREDVPAGTYPLELTDDKARVATLEIGRTTPFRFRGSQNPVQIEGRFYEGWLEIHVPEKDSSWRLVNRLPLERYLLGVLPGEMPVSDYPLEALEAQAVAARSYALFQILVRPAEERIHVYNDTRSQMYLGGGVPHPRAKRAVEATRGKVMLYDGKVFECFFHSTCGGATRSVENCFGGDPIAPLSPVNCAEGCASSKYYRWDARLSIAALSKVLAPVCAKHKIDLGTVLAVEPVEPSLGGHCSFVRIRHSSGAFELDADRFRRLCRGGGAILRSTSFIAERKGKEVVFFGRGWGHGIGLCQVGAKGHAERGVNHTGILTHYYPGAVVTSLWE